jgi:hypothetical protein
MTSTAEGASGRGVFRLGTCLTVVRLSAFDAVEGFPAIGLGVTIILAMSALNYAIFYAWYLDSNFCVL